MDATYALQSCQWMLADLVRAYHRLEPAVAHHIVTTLTSRAIPLVWEVAGVKRVLAPEMSLFDRILVLLYGSTGPVGEEELRRWVEYQNSSRFRGTVLAELHAAALIHHDREARVISISPLGEQHVEMHVLTDQQTLGQAS